MNSGECDEWHCSNSCPLSQWCRPIISSSVTPFATYLLQFYIQCRDPHLFWVFCKWFQGFPGSSAYKECSNNAGYPSLIPGLQRSPGEGIGYPVQFSWASLVGLMVKNLPEMWETWVWSLGWEDHLEKGMATHCSILAWRIPTEEPGGLQSMGPQKSQTWLSNSAQHINDFRLVLF